MKDIASGKASILWIGFILELISISNILMLIYFSLDGQPRLVREINLLKNTSYICSILAVSSILAYCWICLMTKYAKGRKGPL